MGFGIDLNQASLLQNSLDSAATERRNFMLDQRISGYSPAQLENVAKMAGFGGPGNALGSNGTIGGVPIGALGLDSVLGSTGMGGIGMGGMSGGGMDVFSMGTALGGSNGLASQLNQKYYDTLAQQQMQQQQQQQQIQIQQMQQVAQAQQVQQAQAQQAAQSEQSNQMMMMVMLIVLMTALKPKKPPMNDEQAIDLLKQIGVTVAGNATLVDKNKAITDNETQVNDLLTKAGLNPDDYGKTLDKYKALKTQEQAINETLKLLSKDLTSYNTIAAKVDALADSATMDKYLLKQIGVNSDNLSPLKMLQQINENKTKLDQLISGSNITLPASATVIEKYNALKTYEPTLDTKLTEKGITIPTGASISDKQQLLLNYALSH